MKLQDIYDILQKYDACKTEAQVIDLTLKCISEFGATNYLAGEMPPLNLSPMENMNYVISGHWNERWAHRYFSQDYLRKDPTINHVRNERLPLLWGDVKHDDKDGRRVMNEAADFGLRQGITIPQRGLDGKKIGISFAGAHLDLENTFLKTGLTVIAAYAVGAHLRLQSVSDASLNISLSDREVEVLKWLSEGVTSHEAAEKIGIATPTVEKHFRSSLNKLGASNRTHAIAKAMRLGFLN